MSTYLEAGVQHPRLSPYIETYRLIKGEKPIHAKEILPRPGATLLFDLQGLRFYDKEILHTPLIGFHTHPVPCATVSEDRTCFVIKFNGYGLSRFIDTPLDKLTNQVVDAGSVFGVGIEELFLSLKSAAGLGDFIHLTEHWLIARFKEPDSIEPDIFRLADRLRRTDDPLNLPEVRKLVPLGARQLERRFKALVGTDMKTYIRICRFDHAQSLLHTQGVLPISEVGYEAGYFDPAHFSNGFLQLAGTRPRDYSPCTPVGAPMTTIPISTVDISDPSPSA
jgi:AraC-like DNA-binding protein